MMVVVVAVCCGGGGDDAGSGRGEEDGEEEGGGELHLIVAGWCEACAGRGGDAALGERLFCYERRD